MSGELERLLIRLEADTTILRRAMEEAQKSVDGFGSKVNRSLGNIDRRTAKFNSDMSRYFAGIGGAFAAAFSAQALAAQARATVELGNLASTAGMSVEQLSAYRRAAIESGASTETFDKSVAKFAISMGELRARAGGFYEFLQKHLPTLDGQLRKTSSQSEAYGVLMNQVSRLASAEDKAALIKAALGDEAVKLSGFLGQGSAAMKKAADEAERMGAVLDKDAVKHTKELMTQWDLLANETSVRVANAFGRVAEATAPLVKGIRELFANMEAAQLGALAESGAFSRLTDKELQRALTVLNERMQEMVKSAQEAKNAPSFLDSLFGGADGYLARVKELQAAVKATEWEIESRKNSRLAGFSPGDAGKGTTPGTSTAPGTGGMPSKLTTPALGTWQTSTFDIQQAMGGVRAKGATDAFDKIRVEQDNELLQFERLLSEKKINEQEYAEAREAINRASSEKVMKAIEDESALQRAKFAEVEAAIAGPLTNAFDDLFSTGKLNAKSFFAEILSGMARVATQAMIVKPLMDSLFGGPGGGMAGGFLKGALGAFGLPMFAHGGPTLGNRPIMVGERGPEVFVPNTSGRIMNGAQMGRADSGGQVLNFNVSIAGDATDSTVEKFRRVAQQEIARNAPSIVNASVSRVADTHRRDPSYLRR